MCTGDGDVDDIDWHAVGGRGTHSIECDAAGWRDAVADILALQAEYAAWSDNLPDGLRDTATAEALQAIVDLDLDDLTAIVPPCGYGRDRSITK